MGKAIRHKQTQLPKQNGEVARFKVVSGPDQGAIYVITTSPVGIGRGEGSDVLLTDLKASRLHCDLTFTQQGWVIRDLGSANGILHNGQMTRSAVIQTGDTIGIGETLLEFASAAAGTAVLIASPKSLQQVQSEQRMLVAQNQKIQAISSFGGLAKIATSGAPAVSGSVSGSDDADKKKKLGLMAVAALLGVLFLVPAEEAKKKKSPSKTISGAHGGPMRDLASFLPKNDSAEANKTIEVFFKSGFREYREGNFLRAKSQFETVLQINPAHSLARIYLQNSIEAIKEEVDHHLELGKKSLDSGKLAVARGHYEAVLRLLYKDTVNPKYVEARDQLEKLQNREKGQG